MHLFRPEAIQGRDSLHGETLIVRPVSWRALAAFLAAALAAAILYLSQAQHRPQVAARGVVVAGAAGLEATLEAAEPIAAAPGERIGLMVEVPGRPAVPVEGRILESRAASDGRSTVVRLSLASSPVVEMRTPVVAMLRGRPASLWRWITRIRGLGAGE